MAGKGVEASISEFGRALPHRGDRIRRYSKEIETPMGKREIIIVDTNNGIATDSPGLKKIESANRTSKISE